MAEWPPILRARRGFPLPSLRITIGAAALTVILPAVIGWVAAEPLLRAGRPGVPFNNLWNLLSVPVILWRFGLAVTWLAVPLGAAVSGSLARRGWDGLPVVLLVGAAMAVGCFLVFVASSRTMVAGIGHVFLMLPLLGVFLFSALSHAAIYWMLLRWLDYS